MLDLVHDIQKAYRVVLDCMARPGAIGSIQSIAEKAEGFLPMPMAFEVFMHLLLDTEVTFYVCAQQEAVLQRGIHQLTYAREDRLETADYIFMTQNAGPETLGRVLNRVKKGTLSDPHQSATILLEVEKIDVGKGLILQGPGIEGECRIVVSGPIDWVQQRDMANCEYPLGVDLIFVDGSNQVICLPRTTQIMEAEAWAM